jgi:hypothetical protein
LCQMRLSSEVERERGFISMAWGENDHERIIERDISELKETARFISFQQEFNRPVSSSSSGPSDGGAVLLIGLILIAPVVVVLHFLGVDNGDGIFAAIVAILYGIILFLVGVYLWSFKNIFTFIGIALPVTLIILGILYLITGNIIDWLKWKFRRKQKINTDNIKTAKPVNPARTANSARPVSQAVNPVQREMNPIQSMRQVPPVQQVQPANPIQQVKQPVQIRCLSCRNLNREDAVFCTKCGARLMK